MKPSDIRYFDSAQRFHDWLHEHHASHGPVWVAIAKKGCSHHVLRHTEALDAALCFGWIDGVVGRIDGEHYALRFSRRRPGSNWSVVNVVRFGELQHSGAVHPSGRVAFESRDRVVSEDSPAELGAADVAVFEADASAWAFFQSQPPGYRRQASWYVLSSRTHATRHRRLHQLIQLSASRQRLPGYGRSPPKGK